MPQKIRNKGVLTIEAVIAEIEKPIDKFYLLEKTYELLKETQITIRQYPKSEKYALAQDTKKAVQDFMTLIIAAKKKYHKKTTLQDADIKLEQIRYYYRMGKEFHYMNIKRYEILSRLNVEIGKMLGGWIKTNQR